MFVFKISNTLRIKSDVQLIIILKLTAWPPTKYFKLYYGRNTIKMTIFIHGQNTLSTRNFTICSFVYGNILYMVCRFYFLKYFVLTVKIKVKGLNEIKPLCLLYRTANINEVLTRVPVT